MKRTAKARSHKVADAKARKAIVRNAPFEVDASDDGDIATPKYNLSDDEIKEQEDRRS